MTNIDSSESYPKHPEIRLWPQSWEHKDYRKWNYLRGPVDTFGLNIPLGFSGRFFAFGSLARLLSGYFHVVSNLYNGDGMFYAPSGWGTAVSNPVRVHIVLASCGSCRVNKCPSPDVVCSVTDCQFLGSFVHALAFPVCISGLQVYLACSFCCRHDVAYHFVPSGSDGIWHHSTAAFPCAEYCVFCVYARICVTYREGVWESYVTWTRRENEQKAVHHYIRIGTFLTIIIESEMDWASGPHKKYEKWIYYPAYSGGCAVEVIGLQLLACWTSNPDRGMDVCLLWMWCVLM
jgi:hypothetical protein